MAQPELNTVEPYGRLYQVLGIVNPFTETVTCIGLEDGIQCANEPHEVPEMRIALLKMIWRHIEQGRNLLADLEWLGKVLVCHKHEDATRLEEWRQTMALHYPDQNQRWIQALPSSFLNPNEPLEVERKAETDGEPMMFAMEDLHEGLTSTTAAARPALTTQALRALGQPASEHEQAAEEDAQVGSSVAGVKHG